MSTRDAIEYLQQKESHTIRKSNKHTDTWRLIPSQQYVPMAIVKLMMSELVPVRTSPAGIHYALKPETAKSEQPS